LEEEQHYRLLVKSGQSTGIRTAAKAVHILQVKTSTQLSRCYWVRKTNLRANHRTVREIPREADPSIISFADYSQRSASQVLQEKARSTAVWSAQHAPQSRVIFGIQFERR